MTISTLTVKENDGVARMSVSKSPLSPSSHYHAFKKQKEINEKLMDAINATIGWVESTGGCEESIRMLRKAISEV